MCVGRASPLPNCHRCLGALGTLQQPGDAGSTGAGCSRSLPLRPLGHGTSLLQLPPSALSFLPCLSPAVVSSQVLGRSVSAHVVVVAACSLRWGFAGLAWLLGRLKSGMAAGSGRLSNAAHMENTLSNHKKWRWCLKKHTKRSSVEAYRMGISKLPHVTSAGVV